jgi:hypothetical protein
VTAAHPDKRVLVYFQDEARFGQKGVLARVWARRNSRPTAVKQTQYDYLYVFGAVCPSTGDSFGLVAPRVDTVVMNVFLATFAASLPADVHALMILDNAGWHHCKDLVVPANVTPLFLPPRAPELNPIERLWLWLKQHYWANRAYADYEAMVAAVAAAWKATVEEPGRVSSVCHAPYLVRAN